MLLLLKMLTLSFSISRYFFLQKYRMFPFAPKQRIWRYWFSYGVLCKRFKYYLSIYNIPYSDLFLYIHRIKIKRSPQYQKKRILFIQRRHATNRVKFFLSHLFRDEQSGRLLFCKHNLSFTSATTKKDFISIITWFFYFQQIQIRILCLFSAYNRF